MSVVERYALGMDIIMEQEELKKLGKTLLKVKNGGFFVFYRDKRKKGLTDGNTLIVTKKMADGLSAYKKNKSKDPNIVRGAMKYNENKKRFYLTLGEGSDPTLAQKGVKKISTSCPLLRKAKFVTAKEASNTAEKKTELNEEALEQDTLDAFMQEFLFVRPEENMSNEEAFAQYQKDWQKAKKAFNKSIKALYKNLTAQINNYTGPNHEEFKSDLKKYQKILKATLLPEEGKMEKCLSRLKRTPEDPKLLERGRKEAEKKIEYVSQNPTVSHLRTYSGLSIRADVKKCLLIMEKTVAQIEAI